MRWNNIIRNPIKVVIWDLDYVIWAGTLAECNDVKLYGFIPHILSTLNSRGIRNVICSNNYYDDAKKKLIEFGIWPEFMIGSIDFSPKGPRIKRILEEIGVDEENALVIDDNISELFEVKFYNKNVNLVHGYYIEDIDILNNQFLQGNEVISLKPQIRKDNGKDWNCIWPYEDINSFLETIDMHIELIKCDLFMVEQIHKLITSSYQLNYTKSDLTEQELRELIIDTRIRTIGVTLEDKLGEKGLVGFIAYKEDRIEHFVFSHRVLYMGIEQLLYKFLGHPQIDIKEPVAADLHRKLDRDFVSLYENPDVMDESYICVSPELQNKILLCGSCELTRMIDFFTNLCNDITLESTFIKGNQRIVNTGTEYIRSCFDMSDEEKKYCSSFFYNYSSADVFKTQIFSEKFDYIVMSCSDDFIYKVHRNKENKNLRALRDYEYIFGDDNSILDRAECERWLGDTFDNTGMLEADRFYDNLQWIRTKLDPSTILILLTGPERNFYRISFDKNERHKPEVRNQIIKLNSVIKRFAADNPDNVRVIDTNEYLCNMADFTDFLFHWTKEKSYEIAYECLKIMADTKKKKSNNILINCPIGERKVAIWGEGKNARLCFYSLIANGIDVVGIYYHDAVGGDCMVKGDSAMLEGKREDYYILVIDKNYKKIKEQLDNYGYVYGKDYIPLNIVRTYKNQRTDS